MNALLAALLVAVAVALVLPRSAHRRLVAMTRGAGRPWSLTLRTAATSWATRIAGGPQARRRRARERGRIIWALGALASELEAGQPPTRALLRSTGTPSAWPHAERAARWGGDVADALDLDAQGAPVLAQVAACWRVGARGSGLADSIRTVATSARAAEDVRVEMEGQLAGPRATARMLSILPLVGIGLGTLMGSDPLAWLLGTLPGRACLLAGLALTAVGMWWTGRIAASVERRL